jgi:hypothetical protein
MSSRRRERLEVYLMRSILAVESAHGEEPALEGGRDFVDRLALPRGVRAHVDGVARPVGRIHREMLEVEEDDLFARLGVVERDSTGITRVFRRGDTKRMVAGELLVAHRVEGCELGRIVMRDGAAPVSPFSDMQFEGRGGSSYRLIRFTM